MKNYTLKDYRDICQDIDFDNPTDLERLEEVTTSIMKGDDEVAKRVIMSDDLDTYLYGIEDGCEEMKTEIIEAYKRYGMLDQFMAEVKKYTEG